jgi:hypothetical protein
MGVYEEFFILLQASYVRKEERLMFKNFMRWILPFLALALIAMYLVLSPMLASHAAGTATHSHVQTHHSAVSQDETPQMKWRP